MVNSPERHFPFPHAGMAGIEQKPAMPEGAASPINYAAGLGFPKLEWLPQEQWNRPSAEPGIRPLSSTAPLAGLFSGASSSCSFFQPFHISG